MTNMHNRHIASCLCCKHLRCWDAQPDYSDVTPGSPGGVECTQNMADFDPYDMATLLRQLHDLGPECPKFEARED